MKRVFKSTFLCAVFLIVFALSGQAQNQGIKRVNMFYVPTTPEAHLDITFTDDLTTGDAAKIASSRISVVSLPSKTTLVPQDSVNAGGSLRTINIPLSNPSSIPLADTEIKVCFSTVNFKPSTGADIEKESVCATGDILRSDNKAQIIAKRDKVLAELKAAKTSEEKNIFASGFATKASGGDSEGGAEINLNSNDLNIPGLTAFMHLKKIPQKRLTPKHLKRV